MRGTVDAVTGGGIGAELAQPQRFVALLVAQLAGEPVIDEFHIVVMMHSTRRKTDALCKTP